MTINGDPSQLETDPWAIMKTLATNNNRSAEGLNEEKTNSAKGFQVFFITKESMLQSRLTATEKIAFNAFRTSPFTDSPGS